MTLSRLQQLLYVQQAREREALLGVNRSRQLVEDKQDALSQAEQVLHERGVHLRETVTAAWRSAMAKPLRPADLAGLQTTEFALNRELDRIRVTTANLRCNLDTAQGQLDASEVLLVEILKVGRRRDQTIKRLQRQMNSRNRRREELLAEDLRRPSL